jgi:hypothetical protein
MGPTRFQHRVVRSSHDPIKVAATRRSRAGIRQNTASGRGGAHTSARDPGFGPAVAEGTPRGTMNKNDPLPLQAKLSLAELLAQSMEHDALPEPDEAHDRERWDEDEGSFGG